MCRKVNRKSQKLSPLAEITENLPNVSPVFFCFFFCFFFVVFFFFSRNLLVICRNPIVNIRDFPFNVGVNAAFQQLPNTQCLRSDVSTS